MGDDTSDREVMALSHQQRVGRGFEILAEGLAPVVDQLMREAAPAGKDWLELLAARESAKPGGTRKLSKNDPQALLKVITDHRQVFFELLSHSGQRYASELRDVRNLWAHNEKFTFNDTDRALDTMERLLRALGAASAADEIAAQRDEHRGQIDNKRALDRVRKSAPASVTVSAEKLGTWRDVMIPHEDVRKGEYARAEFAADLHQVATGKTSSEEYADPVQFFRRTYLTDGLKELLTNTARRLSGDGNAEPVFNLQTNFGGGKTHSMLAVWHLYSPNHELDQYPQAVQDMLGGIPLREGVRRVALVGNHIETAKPSSEDGRPGINTLWGELAWQLGGREAYDIVAESDQARVPSGASLEQLLTAYAPCVILIDEWVSYARLLHGRTDLPGGTFEAQFTFAQTMTELAKTIPGIMFIVSVPASHDPKQRRSEADEAEVGGLRGKETLERLQNVVGRVAKHWRPATPDESFEIVRRRLFEQPTERALKERDFIAKALVRFYREHSAEFPHEVTETKYESEIKAAYPIHPELFHRLYEDWSTLERFQKTRGVLRLMSAVIYRLWQAEDPAPLIMPGSLPLGDEWVLGEVTHYLSDTWKAVIEADVDSSGSTPERIDASRAAFSQRHLTRRLARAAFLASAARTGAQQKGVERKRIWLGTALPGDVVGNFGSAIHLLSEQALYFYADGTSYWYDTQQSVNRLARDRAEEYRSHLEDVYEEIVKRLKEHDFPKKGLFVRVQPAPKSTDEVPDRPESQIVIVHPRLHYSSQVKDNPAFTFANEALASRGNSPRTNQNMLVFAVADREPLTYLTDAVREYLAWNSIVEDKELPIPPDQAKMARKRHSTASDTVSRRIEQAYNTVLYPIWDKNTGRIGLQAAVVDEDGASIPERVSAKLKNIDKLRTEMGSRLIRYDLDKNLSKVWKDGHISFGVLWEYYRRFPYLGRLRNRAVLEESVRRVFDELTGSIEGFAVASAYDEDTGKYIELAIPNAGEWAPAQITDSTLLVQLDRAKEQRAREEREREERERSLGSDDAETDGDSAGDTTGTDTEDGDEVQSELETTVKNTRFWATYGVNPERFTRDLTRLGPDLLALLTAPDGVELEVTVQIEARRAEGFPDDTVMKVVENLTHLKAKGNFEDR
ncbi:ATP-binding protein [Actinomadura sp. KC06]|uniref:DUF499 domain-containing protein n=1 Tax=Actinomadura sp. KC06 TaxID=2530369 RepID=UPI0010472CEE|nr:DUF499 domain-containing protein [Actinomadura sp. KC06]TDD36827.1 ATP-binding protein [Actinomadura sp. KC06]